MTILNPQLLFLGFLFAFMFIKTFGSRISDSWQNRSERQRLRKKRHAQPPIKKPKTEIEFPYIEGSGDKVVSIGIVLIFVSLLLPYRMVNLGELGESPSIFSGLYFVSDLPANIDWIRGLIEAGVVVDYVVLVGLEALAPIVFLITAIMAWKFRGSERLPSYRKSEGDNLVLVRIVGKFHLLYFAASIIAMLVYYRNDILFGATQLLPIDDGDWFGNWGLGFWLGGLSGILIAYPERIAALTIGEIPGYVIRDVWKGIKDPWIYWWNWGFTDDNHPPKLNASRDDAKFLPVYYASTTIVWIFSIPYMFSFFIIVILFILALQYLGLRTPEDQSP